MYKTRHVKNNSMSAKASEFTSLGASLAFGSQVVCDRDREVEYVSCFHYDLFPPLPDWEIGWLLLPILTISVFGASLTVSLITNRNHDLTPLSLADIITFGPSAGSEPFLGRV